MDGAGRGSKLRSFAIGGVVGAAGAIATVRRASRRSRGPAQRPGQGSTAFEEAPCFLELVGGRPTVRAKVAARLTGPSKPR